MENIKYEVWLQNQVLFFLITWYLLFKCLLHLTLQKFKFLLVFSCYMTNNVQHQSQSVHIENIPWNMRFGCKIRINSLHSITTIIGNIHFCSDLTKGYFQYGRTDSDAEHYFNNVISFIQMLVTLNTPKVQVPFGVFLLHDQ
jgi:hypothetical protein